MDSLGQNMFAVTAPFLFVNMTPMLACGVEVTLVPVILGNGTSWKNAAFVDLTFVWDMVWKLY
jgi:hypothetical protein